MAVGDLAVLRRASEDTALPPSWRIKAAFDYARGVSKLFPNSVSAEAAYRYAERLEDKLAGPEE